MGRRGNKRRAGAPPAAPPAASPADAGRKRRRIAIAAACIGVLALLAAGIGIPPLLRDAGKEEAGAGSAAVPHAAERAEALIDPRLFQAPPELPPERRLLAEQAVAAHLRALEAQFAKDMPAFERQAVEALRLYDQAGWVFADLGQLHHLLLVARFQAGDLQTVIRQGRRWLERFPGAPRQLETVAKAEYLAGQYAEAARRFEEYRERYPGSPATLRQLAETYSALGAKEKALAAVDEDLARIGFPAPGFWSRPQAAEAMRTALGVTHRFYDYDRVERIAAPLLERFPDDAEALMALGVAKRYRGDHAGAVLLLRRFLDAAPAGSTNREPVRIELAISLLKLGRHLDALSELVALLDENPENNQGYFQLGQCLARLERPRAADAMFAMAQAFAPADREFRREIEQRGAGRTALAARARARGFALSGRFREGSEAMREAAAGSDPAALVYRIEYLMSIIQVPEARRAIERLESLLGPASDDVRGWKAEALRLEGKPEEAAAIWAEICRRRDRLPIWGMRLGRTLLEELASPAEAARWLGALLEVGPDATARILLGRALLEAGDVRRAREALEAVPPQEDEWKEEAGGVWLALCRLRAGETEAAGRDLDAAEGSARHLAAFHRARAGWLEASGAASADPERTEKAAAARTQAARLEDLDREFRAELARAALSEGGGAAAHLLAAARLRAEMGDRAGSLRMARLAAAADPRSRAAWETLEGWLDRPAEIFLRNQARRQLTALDPAAAAPLTAKELAAALLQREE